MPVTDTSRLAELVDRLIAAGPKAAHVSASETHEIHDDVIDLIAERDKLVAERDKLVVALADMIDWATKFGGSNDDTRWLTAGGHSLESLPMFTRIGARTRDEALAAARALVAPDTEGVTK